MTVKELQELLQDLPADDHICFAVWFGGANPETLYAPHRELGPIRSIVAEGALNVEPFGKYHVIGRCDNCLGDKVTPAT